MSVLVIGDQNLGPTSGQSRDTSNKLQVKEFSLHKFCVDVRRNLLTNLQFRYFYKITKKN